MPTESTNGRELVKGLPPWYPDSNQSDLYWIMDAIGHRLDDLDDDLAAVDRASMVQTADTVDQIAEQAKLVNTTPRDGEGRESYRARSMSQFKLNTGEGTVGDIIQVAADILNVDVEKIQYKQLSEAGAVQLAVPGEKLDTLNMTVADFTKNVNDQIGAGYRVDISERGTLEYTDPSTYDATSDWSGTPGYDTLDGSGTNTPEGEGGTYSGLL